MSIISNFIFVLALAFFGTIYGWNNQLDLNKNTGKIKGIVKNEQGDALPGANIIVIENGTGSSADITGRFEIIDLNPGAYTLKISHIAYETSYKKVLVYEGKAAELTVQLKNSLFQIGGIEVIGSSELLTKEASTKTIITSGEIEHYQASSVKDVLDLVPGVQRSNNPGLSETGQIAIRGDIGGSNFDIRYFNLIRWSTGIQEF